MVRTRVLVVQPSLQPPGGGNAVAAWMVHALKDRHEVSILTWRRIDLGPVNDYYGTAIQESDITRVEVPRAMRAILDALPTSSVLLKASLVFRHAKRIAGQYDAIVCGHNETDLGARCVQYVHYPARLRPRPAVDLRWYHVRWLLAPYYAFCDRVIAGFVPGRVAEATTLANSQWTADLVSRLYSLGTGVRVLHPPVTSEIEGRPWPDRQNGFVCIGRLAPEKELERVMRIIAAVRQRVPDVHLHLIGSRGPESYMRRITRLAREHGDWVQIHEDVTRAALFEFIATHRYGIHGMREEHFGIAPAEAMSGGCIVFVPNAGGQVDIVGDDRLLYGTDDDAVEKIVRVMADPDEQARLAAYLAGRRAQFSTAHFIAEIQDLVQTVVSSATADKPSAIA